EVMQLPSEDELVLVAGLPPIRARKLRYFADANFAERVASPPVLAGDRYADCPPPRAHDWEGAVCAPDDSLADCSIDDAAVEAGGLEQQRSPELPEQSASQVEEPEPELAEAASDDDPVAEKRAMDQARSLSAAVRG